MDKILKNLEEETGETVSLEEIINMNPPIFTLTNPMTFIAYLDYNPNLTTEYREIVIRIIKTLKDKQEKINEINFKKFDEEQLADMENKIIYHNQIAKG